MSKSQLGVLPRAMDDFRRLLSLSRDRIATGTDPNEIAIRPEFPDVSSHRIERTHEDVSDNLLGVARVCNRTHNANPERKGSALKTALT